MRDILALKLFSAKSISILLNAAKTDADFHAVIYFFLVHPLTLMMTELSHGMFQKIVSICLKVLLELYEDVVNFTGIDD